jgi:hypothetical protein
MFNKIIRVAVYLLVFLVPVFFLPFTYEAFEFNKQYLLLFLTSIAVLAWLGKMIIKDKEIRFKRTPLDLPILGFMGIAILSGLLSVDKMSSLFGFYGRFSDGLIGLLCLGALFFVITNLCGRGEKIGHDDKTNRTTIGKNDRTNGTDGTNKTVLTVSGIVRAFMASIVAVVVMSYMTIFGVWNWIGNLMGRIGPIGPITEVGLPNVMLSKVFNPIGGSMEALAMFLAVAVVLIVGRVLTTTIGRERIGQENRTNRTNKAMAMAMIVGAVGLLFIIDFTQAWIVLFVTLILFIVIAIKKRMFKENVNKLLLPILLVAIAGISMGVSYDLDETLLRQGYGGQVGPMQHEQILGQGTSWKVSFGALTENAKSVFLGSGPGTFNYDFAKFKPVEFNKTDFWQIRYDRSGTHIAEVLGTMGILGFLCYLAIAGLFLTISIFFFQIVMTDKSKSILPFLMAFSAVLVSQIVYYQNITLMFLFWLFLALGTVFWQRRSKEKVFSLKEIPEISLVFSVILIFTILGTCAMFYSMAKFYIADNAYAKSGVKIEQLEKVVRLNPYQAQYKIMLSRMHLEKVKAQIAKPLNEQDQTELSDNVYLAITYLKGDPRAMIRGAVEIAPNRVAVHETLGMIYREIQGLAEGSTDWSIKSFEKARELEPTNPVFHVELGKLYLISSPEDKEKSRQSFEKAIEMKDEYIEAHTLTIMLMFCFT